MAILGHSQIGVTMNVDTHVATEDQRATVGLLGGLLDRTAQAEDTHSRQTAPMKARQRDQKVNMLVRTGGRYWV